MFFKSVLAFESRKFLTWRNLKFFLALFIVLAFFLWEGLSDYRTLSESKKYFQNMERDKVSRHIHYTLYGIRGVRLLLIPNPISVMYNDLAVYSSMAANVDTGEGLYIYNSFKGKEIFDEAGGYMDFSGIVLLFGCFFALIYGFFATQNKNYLKFLVDISGSKKIFLSIVVARIILLNLAVLLLSGLSLLLLFIWDINAINVYFLSFTLELILVTTIFVLIGAVCGSIKEKIKKFAIPVIVYFLLLLFIPWLVQKVIYTEAAKSIKSIYEFEYEEFKVIMELEKRLYERFGVWKSGGVAPDKIQSSIQECLDIEYKKLREYEERRLAGIYERIKAYQAIAAIFPTTFYLSVNKEISSKGFLNFIEFYKYAYKMKYEFIKFYIIRKFNNPYPKKGVESFIKGSEDIFQSQSQLPFTFWWGNGLMLIYIAGLFFILYRDPAKKVTQETKKNQIAFEKGEKNLFVLCKDDRVKGDIFRFYRSRENNACLDRIAVDFQFNGLQVKTVLQYLSRLAVVNRDKAVDYLSILGTTDLSAVNPSSDDILKIYTAVKIAADSTAIVFNDFFKMNSRQFEDSCFKLLSYLEKTGKKILYLSCELPYPKDTDSLAKKINLKTFTTFPLQLDKVTLR